MSREKDDLTGKPNQNKAKKRYVYLERFEKHEQDQYIVSKTQALINKVLTKRVIVSLIISVAALGIAFSAIFIKYFRG